MATMTYVVAYDVADDRRRARTSALLQQFGDRVQRSVFVLLVDATRVEEIVAAVNDCLDADHDSLYVWRQCSSCWEGVIAHGQARIADEPAYWAIL